MIAQWLREKLSTAVNPASWFIDWIRGEPVTSGVSVTEQTALCYSAVWAATVFVSSAIASLPCLLFRAIAADDRGREVDDWRYGLLKSRPNPEQDSFIFWQEQAMYLVNSGNCYAEKSYFPTGRVAELWPLPPNRVKPYRDGPGGPVRYEITSETGAKRYADRADVLHVTGQLADDGIVGRGVIRQARESIGLGIATERYGGSFFGNSAVPGGVLEHPGKYNEKAEKNLREGWERMHRGPDKGSRTAVLFEGAKFSSIGIDNDDAQFLQTRQHNVTEIARWYGLPPHILADLTRGTFSNIEQQDLEVVKYCLRFWLVRLERALGHQLLGPEEKDLYWEFLLDAFLRGDTATRTAAFVQQFLNGAMTLNEWRRAENRNRIPGEDGDRHFVPLNLVPLDRAGQGRGGRRLRPDGADRGQRPAPGGPAPGQAPDGKAKEEEDEEEQRSRSAARAVVADACARMERIEANALRRAARHPESFLRKWEEFAAGHRDLAASAILPGLAVWLAARGVTGDPALFAAMEALARVTRLTAAVLRAAECRPEELIARVDALLESPEFTWSIWKGLDEEV